MTYTKSECRARIAQFEAMGADIKQDCQNAADNIDGWTKRSIYLQATLWGINAELSMLRRLAGTKAEIAPIGSPRRVSTLVPLEEESDE